MTIYIGQSYICRGMEEWIQMLSEMEQGCDPSEETTDKLTALIRLSLQDDIRYNNNY